MSSLRFTGLSTRKQSQTKNTTVSSLVYSMWTFEQITFGRPAGPSSLPEPSTSVMHTSNASFKECIRIRSRSLLSNLLKLRSRAEAADRFRLLLDGHAARRPRDPREPPFRRLSLPELSSSGKCKTFYAILMC